MSVNCLYGTSSIEAKADAPFSESIVVCFATFHYSPWEMSLPGRTLTCKLHGHRHWICKGGGLSDRCRIEGLSACKGQENFLPYCGYHKPREMCKINKLLL